MPWPFWAFFEDFCVIVRSGLCMRQVTKLFKAKHKFDFIKSFRVMLLILLVFPSFYSLAEIETKVDAVSLYKSKDFNGALKAVQAKRSRKEELTYKDHIVLIKSYEKLSKHNQQLATLRSAVLLYPKRDVFKRELVKVLEAKSNSHNNNIAYAKMLEDAKKGNKTAAEIEILKRSSMKVLLQAEAVKLLNDLYTDSPTKENFTALIQFYNEKEFYEEALGLLELYGRSKPKRVMYYSYLCEAQYKAKLYSTALETCRGLSKNYPKKDIGHLYYVKALEKVGELELAQNGLIELKGRFPASGSMQFEIGKALIAKGKYSEGLSHLEKHIKLESTDEALVLKAETLFKIGSYEEALAAYITTCKQHKEPRKPLFVKINIAAKSLDRSSLIRKKYEKAVRSCKYTYRPKKIVPKGVLGRSF